MKAIAAALTLLFAFNVCLHSEEPAVTKAFIDGQGPGWRTLGESDFTQVNCPPETWKWTNDVVYCTGQPIGVTRTREKVKNFELVEELT